MAVTLGSNTISGVGNGGLPANNITVGNIGYAGAILQVQHVQTRTQGTYAASANLGGGAGTEIAPLTINITCQKAGNRVVLEWMVNNECHWDVVYMVTRNNVVMANSSNGSTWSGLVTNNYTSSGDNSSTPVNDHLVFLDTSCLAGLNTYRLHIKGSGASAYTYYLNRTVSSAGQDSYEAGVSTVTATEINV